MRVGFKNKMIFVLCALYIYRSLGISVAFFGWKWTDIVDVKYINWLLVTPKFYIFSLSLLRDLPVLHYFFPPFVG